MKSQPPPALVDEDWPPAVFCSRCGRSDCADLGCVQRDNVRSSLQVVLEWEQAPGPWPLRLWRTALATSQNPEHTFARLPSGGLLTALAFGFGCEALALGSLGLLAALPAVVVISLMWGVLDVRVAFQWATALWGVAVGFMLLVHVLWGVCIELGARVDHTPSRMVQGVRFGLYACGWDLVTSPVGLCVGVLTRGFHAGLAMVAAAVRAPRPSLNAYTHGHRQLSAQAQRQGMILSIAAFGVLVLFLLGVAACVVYLWIRALL